MSAKGPTNAATQTPPAPVAGAVIAHAREVLRPDPGGRLPRRGAERIVRAIQRLQRTGHQEAIHQLLIEGFLRGSEERYEHVRPFMRPIPGTSFQMGSAETERRHFCGETPDHNVELSPFLICDRPLVKGLLDLFDATAPARSAGERHQPAVEITWWEATLFAMWLGCRLPSEAEWELACGAGRASQWCCSAEEELTGWAWYSENANGQVHEVAELQPNSFGLYDMHGNVWEWCGDLYDQDYYARSPRRNPVNLCHMEDHTSDRVTRGGSMNSLAEMCRTRYRLHEPPTFWAGDLGFRLARSAEKEVRR